MVSCIDLRRLGSFAVLGAVLLLFSCSDDDHLIQPENHPPDTTLEMEGPQRVDGRTEILLRWSGSDPEGGLSHYEWRLVRPEEVEADVAWTSTEEVEKRLDLTEQAATRKETVLRFEVRAVDVGGLRDLSPASGSFTPVTQAPTVQIDMPVTITCLSAPEGGLIRWTADDPESKSGPEATRVLVLEVGEPGAPCLTRLEFEQDNPFLQIATSDPRWSDWVDYDPDDPLHPSRSLPLNSLQVGYSYLIGVQARDVDGATTRSFDWNENVAHIRIAPAGAPPLLTVFEPYLGLEQFLGTLGEKRYQVPAGDQLHFQWSAAPSGSFGQAIDAYRVGLDVVDPDDPNDPGWLGPWGSAQELAYDVPQQGSHNVVIQVRDLAGVISRAEYLLQVVQSPAALRDLLLVDDWRNSPTSSGQQLEAQQDQAWTDLLDAALPGGWDVLDAQDETASLDLVKLLEYRSVIWFTNASDLSFLHTAFAPDSQGNERYNWLEAAQRNQVSLMLVGPGAAWSLVERPGQPKFFPLVFDVPAGASLGFGELELPSGEVVNRGTLRAPYRSLCVDLLDLVRPPLGQVYGEVGGEFERTLSCDAMLFADPAAEFSSRFPGAPSVVLRPTPARENLDPQLQLPAEEFYDVNVTTRPDVPSLRDCKVPMFRLRSRRSGNVGVDPATCSPSGEVSPIEEVPVALASFAYSEVRDDPGRADFLWGFNPLGFVAADVETVLEWILLEHWGLGS